MTFDTSFAVTSDIHVNNCKRVLIILLTGQNQLKIGLNSFEFGEELCQFWKISRNTFFHPGKLFEGRRGFV